MTRDQRLADALREVERWRKDARAYANVELSEENDRLIDEKKRLQEVAGKLAREVKASFELYEPLARREMGNSNYRIIVDAAAEVIALTSAST